MPRVRLEFGPSPSRYFATARGLAERLPCTIAPDGGQITVELLACPEGVELLRLVAGWKSARVWVDDRPGPSVLSVLRVLECAATRGRSPLGELYCWGLPGGEQRVPCRVVDAFLPWAATDPAVEVPAARLVAAIAQECGLAVCAVFDQHTVAAELEAARERRRRLGIYDLEWPFTTTYRDE